MTPSPTTAARGAYGGAYGGYDDDRLTTGDGPTGLIYPNGSSYSVNVGREEVDD